MEKRITTVLGWMLSLGLVLLFGCARDRYEIVDATAGLVAPQPPLIFTTPAICLLTNAPMFQADVRIEETGGASAGRLYGRGTKLLYAPREQKRPRRSGPSGRFSFIWDAAEGKGYVLSEALQGYAPISLSSSGVATNLTRNVSQTGASGAQNVLLTASMSNGTKEQFQAHLSSPRESVPVKITGDSPPFTATFDNVLLTTPPREAFNLPEGFTAYPSAEAMVDELAARYRNLNRKVYPEGY